MSNPVEKNLKMKKNKVRGSVLRLLDADFKILEKWIKAKWIDNTHLFLKRHGRKV